MKSVILTGANGFIGRHAILPLIGRKFIVHAITTTQPDSNLLYKNVIWHQVNLLNKVEIKEICRKIKATHLMHFAWNLEHGRFWNAPENKLWLDAGVELVEQVKANGGERVVIAGTCAEYEWGGFDILSEKKSPLRPQSFYGQCKLELQKRISEINISQAWGRIFSPFGEFENPNRLIPSVIRSLLKNEFADCTHGGQIRDFIYVGDLANAFADLVNSDAQGAINIASGRGQTIKQIVLHTADLLDKVEMVRFGRRIPPENDPPSIVADVSRLNSEIDWQEKIGITKGIKKTIKFWMEQMEK